MSTVMPPALLSEDVLALMVNCQDTPDRDTIAFSKMKSVFSPDKLSRCPPSPATVFSRGGIDRHLGGKRSRENSRLV